MKNYLLKIFVIIILVFNFTCFSFAKERVIIGMVPYRNPVDVLKKHKRVLNYLEKETGFEFFIKFAKDYKTIIKNAEKKEYDIVVFGPASYIEATEKCDLRAFVVPSRKGRIYCRSIIIILKNDENIKSLQDLNNSKMAFSDIHSTAGFIYPIVELYRKNIKPKVYIIGRQDKAVYSVYRKKYSAAAGYDDIRRDLKQKEMLLKKTKILYRSKKFPHEPWTIKESINQVKKAKIKEAFHKLEVGKEITKNVLKGMTFQGFVEIEDKNYDCVRQTLKEYETIKEKIEYFQIEQ